MRTASASRTLVVGCGMKPKAGCVNLDCVKLPGVDVVMDLNAITAEWTNYANGIGELATTPNGRFIPFPSNHFDRIEAEDVLEHVDNPIAVVQELGRVLKPEGILWIRGPDYRFGEIVWADLTHKRAFALRSFSGFDPETFDGKHYGHYHGPIKFKL